MTIIYSSPIVAASLLASDFADFASEVSSLEKANIDWLHIDVMDGHFVPSMAITAPTVHALRQRTHLPLDVHLMVDSPAQYIKTFAEAGADYLTVHIEADRHIHATLELIHCFGMKAGVAINPSTPIGVLDQLWSLCDLVLIMTVNPGFGGQKFLVDQICKIQKARNKIDLLPSNSRPLLSVDGGINQHTAAKCIAAGADVLDVGSAIFTGKNKDYTRNILALREAHMP